MITYGAPLPITETKARDDFWEVIGYAATYDNVDLGNDVILPGAFDRWLASGQKTRLLHSHRPDKVLGTLPQKRSDKIGLKVHARISKTPLGEETYTLVQDGAIDSFSIGYIAVDSVNRKDGVRELKDLDLPEVSLVAIPMNPQAVVTAWKDWLSAFGQQPEEAEPPTLAKRAEQINAALANLLNDTKSLLDNGRDLNQKKRDELTQLLEMFSGLDDVRSGVTALVNYHPHGEAEARKLLYGISERRARLARILGE